MRIRRSATSSLSPPSPSLCSSSSSCFSSPSSTTTHSTISTHSLTSSSNSTSSSSPSLSLSSSSSSSRRCQGLDLLVKAVYYVAGSIVGVPYIQRRVIRRRKPPISFHNLVINFDDVHLDVHDEVLGCSNNNDNNLLEKLQVKKTTTTKKIVNKKNNNNKQKRKSKVVVPSKLHDSVLQSWKPKDRPRRRSIKS